MSEIVSFKSSETWSDIFASIMDQLYVVFPVDLDGPEGVSYGNFREEGKR